MLCKLACYVKELMEEPTQYVLRKIAKHVHNSIPVLHWFTGTEKEVLQAIDLGCWVSIGPAMLSSSSGRRIACLLPLNRAFSETDGTFATKTYCYLCR